MGIDPSNLKISLIIIKISLLLEDVIAVLFDALKGAIQDAEMEAAIASALLHNSSCHHLRRRQSLYSNHRRLLSLSLRRVRQHHHFHLNLSLLVIIVL